MNFKIESRKAKDLREHPQQKTIFGTPPTTLVATIAASLKTNGMDHPIEITSDNVVIAGHCRLQAAILLGMETVDVVVRSDVEALGPDAVLHRLIGDNTCRRQLGPLGKVRVYRAAKALAKKCGPGAASANAETREQLAERLGLRLTVRQLDRLERMLALPQEIQDAVDGGILTAAAATRMLKLSSAELKKIGQQLETGELHNAKPAQVKRKSKTDRVKQKLTKVYESLEAAIQDLPLMLDVNPNHLKVLPENARKVLQKGIELLQRLVAPKPANAGTPDSAVTKPTAPDETKCLTPEVAQSVVPTRRRMPPINRTTIGVTPVPRD